MKDNQITSHIIVFACIIIGIFFTVLTLNLLPNYESNLHFIKLEDDKTAQIKSLEINNNELTIKTSGDAIEYCLKTTRTIPKEKSLCWNQINDKAIIQIYSNKKYYVWIKNKKGNISDYSIIDFNK